MPDASLDKPENPTVPYQNASASPRRDGVHIGDSVVGGVINTGDVTPSI